MVFSGEERSLTLTQLGEAHSGKEVDGRRLSLLKFLAQPTAPLMVKWNKSLCEGDYGSPKIYLHVSVVGSGLGKTSAIFRVWRAKGNSAEFFVASSRSWAGDVRDYVGRGSDTSTFPLQFPLSGSREARVRLRSMALLGLKELWVPESHFVLLPRSW